MVTVGTIATLLGGVAWADKSVPVLTCAPGGAEPLGAQVLPQGVNFSLYSRDARQVWLCLFDERGQESRRYALTRDAHGVWSGWIPGLSAGQAYGYRLDGEFAPERGLYFNPHKLMLDPYAKRVNGVAAWSKHLYPKRMPDGAWQQDNSDNAAQVVKAVVSEDSFDWGQDRQPRTAWRDTVLYEINVKGFSQLNPAVPAELRGTYAGLGSPASIEHLRQLGVTAVELLPIYLCLSEGHLARHGLSNYWGYNPAGLFVPDPRFSASGDSVNEFKAMVKQLHSAGIEVILDVVYNHSAEQGQAGPNISWRGIDNRTYYKLDGRDAGRYVDYTGCGNSFDLRQEATLQMVLDSLRYWVTEMHVDGFRFDLASVLGRVGEEDSFSREAPFFKALDEDPVLSQVKLIAEPWDCAAGGYQIGNYPDSWSEWNGEWRDTLRRFWRGDRGQVRALADKLMGAPERYTRRSPRASINFVTCHDGFTMHDIVSYNVKHNLANGEDNRDGSNDNYSWNSGREGECGEADIAALRRRQVRNMMMSIAFSQGVPMLLGGDELGRTQRGNNNAYCQDNEISYLNWEPSPEKSELLDFVRRLLELRRSESTFRLTSAEEIAKAVRWYDRHGQALELDKLDEVGENCLTMRLLGQDSGTYYALLLNSEGVSRRFVLPAIAGGTGQWQVVIGSAEEAPRIGSDGCLDMIDHSACLLRYRP